MTMQKTPLLMSRLMDRGAWIAPGEQIDLFKMIASFDRPEVGVRALPEAVIDEAVREYVENGVEAAVRLLGEDARPVFDLLETVSTKLQTNNEMDSLVRALRGEFIEPGPGADRLRTVAGGTGENRTARDARGRFFRRCAAGFGGVGGGGGEGV